MTRVFLALNLPLDIKQDIFALYNKTNTPKIKWTAFDNLHITVKFIGGIEEGQLEKLQNFLKNNLKIPKINLEIKNTIFFPEFSHPKIIALQGIIASETKNKINAFLNLLQQELKFIPKNNHPFTPHITIGRVKGYIDRSQYEFKYENECSINNIDLMKSTLTPTGPIYEIIKNYNLIS